MDMREWLKQQRGAGGKRSMPVLSFPAISLMNVSVRTLVSDSDLQARGMQLVAERCPTSASVSMMDLSVEAEAFGCRILVPDDEVPTVVAPLVESRDDVKALSVPSPSSGRTGLYVEAIRKALTRIGDRPVFAGVIGPFSLAGRLMDMNEIMVTCYDDPDMVHETLMKTTDFIAAYAGEYKKAGAHGVVMAEPAAGLLSPELCEEFSSRYVKRIVDAVRGDDFLFIYHNCGNTVPLLDSLLGFAADGYHFGNAVNLEEVLEHVPGDTLVMGNVDPSGVFRMGTPELVRRETLALLERCARYPNFSISSGCDIPPLSPWENIDAYFSAISEFYGQSGGVPAV